MSDLACSQTPILFPIPDPLPPRGAGLELGWSDERSGPVRSLEELVAVQTSIGETVSSLLFFSSRLLALTRAEYERCVDTLSDALPTLAGQLGRCVAPLCESDARLAKRWSRYSDDLQNAVACFLVSVSCAAYPLERLGSDEMSSLLDDMSALLKSVLKTLQLFESLYLSCLAGCLRRLHADNGSFTDVRDALRFVCPTTPDQVSSFVAQPVRDQLGAFFDQLPAAASLAELAAAAAPLVESLSSRPPHYSTSHSEQLDCTSILVVFDLFEVAVANTNIFGIRQSLKLLKKWSPPAGVPVPPGLLDSLVSTLEKDLPPVLYTKIAALIEPIQEELQARFVCSSSLIDATYRCCKTIRSFGHIRSGDSCIFNIQLQNKAHVDSALSSRRSPRSKASPRTFEVSAYGSIRRAQALSPRSPIPSSFHSDSAASSSQASTSQQSSQQQSSQQQSSQQQSSQQSKEEAPDKFKLRRAAWAGERSQSKFSGDDIKCFDTEILNKQVEASSVEPAGPISLDTGMDGLSAVRLPRRLVRCKQSGLIAVPKLDLASKALAASVAPSSPAAAAAATSVAPVSERTRERRNTLSRSRTPRRGGLESQKTDLSGETLPSVTSLLGASSFNAAAKADLMRKKTPTQEIEEFRRLMRLNAVSDTQQLSSDDLALADLFEEPDSPSNVVFVDDTGKSGWAVHVTASNAADLKPTFPKTSCNAQVWVGVVTKKKTLPSPRAAAAAVDSEYELRDKPKHGLAVEATTSVVPRCNAPYWNETHTLFAKPGDSLYVEVQDVSRLKGKKTVLGAVHMPIPFDRPNDQALSWVPQWLALKHPKDESPAGRLCVRLWIGVPNSKPSGRQVNVTTRTLKAASAAKMICILTDSQGVYASLSKGRQAHASIFLLTFRSVMKPLELLRLLRIRFLQPAPSYVPEAERSRWQYQHSQPIQLHVVNTLRMWIEQHPYDFVEDAELLAGFDALAGLVHSVNAKLGDILVRSIGKFRRGADRTSATYSDPAFAPLMKPPRHAFVWTEAPPLELARQMTLVDENAWLQLRPWELQGQLWAKPTTIERCPNVAALIGTHNRTKNWIVSEVLAVDDVKERAIVLSRLIMLAEELKNLHNFHTAMSVVAGLNSATVIRLRNSWSLLPSKIVAVWDALQQLFSPESNSINLRNALVYASPPAIPYLGLFMKDLTFIEDGNPDFVGGLINYSKLEMIGDILKTIQLFQQKGYSFTPLFFIQDYLASLPVDTPDERAQFERSLQLCPRAQK